jgi:5-methylcytosine-specific restriction endonuclease McrA
LHVHHKDRNPASNQSENLEVLCASCHLKLHWSEDRENRLEAKLTGDRMNQLLGAGKWSSVVKRRRLPKQPDGMAGIA